MANCKVLHLLIFLLSSALSAHSSTVVFNVSGTMTDGATLSGTVTLDNVAGTAIAGSVTLGPPVSLTFNSIEGSGVSDVELVPAVFNGPVAPFLLLSFSSTLVGYLGGSLDSFTRASLPGGAFVYIQNGRAICMSTIPQSTAPTQSLFTLVPGCPFATGTYPYAIAVGDFNMDGKLDLVTANGYNSTAPAPSSNSLTVLLGNGSGGFTATAQSPIPLGTYPGALAVGDFNQDGKPDLAVALPGSGSVAVLLGNGSGNFTSAPGSPINVGGSPSSIAVADFNGDGTPDMAVANGYVDVTILLGNGSGGFAEAPGSPFMVGSFPHAVATGDFNSDGKMDLAVAGNPGGPGPLTILIGDGSGRFTQAPGSPYTIGTNVSNPFFVAVADFNMDGKLDLAVPDAANNNVAVLLGDGAGGFRPAAGSPFSVGAGIQQPASIAVGDFNGDGRPDLAVADSTPTTGVSHVTVLLGDGSGSFTAVSIVTADFNGDGKQDLAVSNDESYDVTVLLNAGATRSQIATFVNAASLQTGPVAPNTIVSMFLSTLSCALPQIAVNGTAAQILGAAATQINFVVPGTATGTSATVQLKCDTVVQPLTSPLPMAAVAPSILTVTQTGSGQGAILNQDWTVNSATNPASAGSYIEVYATGFGALNPPSADGLRHVTGTVTAQLGSIPATVVYAGESPGSTLGLQQINIQVPMNTPIGPAVPLLLTVGGVSTQTGVTVAIQ